MTDGNAPAMSGPSGPIAGPSGYGAAGPSNGGVPRGAPLGADGYNPYIPASAAAAAAIGAGSIGAASSSRPSNRNYTPVSLHDGDGDGYVSPPRGMSPQRLPNTSNAGSESSNLLGAPAAAAAAGASRGHRPQYSVDSDAGDLGNAEPYRDVPGGGIVPENPFVDPSDPTDVDRQSRWPMNPRGDNGLTPPGTASSGRRGGSALNAGPGPSGFQGSDQMREVRRAWGWEQ
jgi:hypothetical protein